MKAYIIVMTALVVCTVMLYYCRPAKSILGQEKLSNVFVKFNSKQGIWKNVTTNEQHTPVGPEEPVNDNKGIQSVDSQGNQVITWKLNDQGNRELIDIMMKEVEGIDESQAKKLILSRARWDWKSVPDSIKDDQWQGMYSFQLKNEIKDITEDIAGVLNAPIGDVRYPPKMDLIIRTNMEEEIEAIKKN